MLRIQHGLAGFFIGVFTAFLLGLIELRIVDSNRHPSLLFFVISLTVIVCGITGMIIGLRIAEKKKNKHR